MATFTIEKITLPNGDVCNLQDANAVTDVQIGGSSVVSNGVATVPAIYTGTISPTAGTGSVGDIYIKTE